MIGNGISGVDSRGSSLSHEEILLDDNTLWLGPSSSDTTTRYVFTCIDLRVRPEAVAKEQAVRGDTGDGALEILVPTGQGARVRVRG